MYKLIKPLIKTNIVAILCIFTLQFISSAISMFTPYLNGAFIDYLISVSIVNKLFKFISLIIILSIAKTFLEKVERKITKFSSVRNVGEALQMAV